MSNQIQYEAARRPTEPDIRDFSEGSTIGRNQSYSAEKWPAEYLDKDHDSDAALRKIRTAGSISISPEVKNPMKHSIDMMLTLNSFSRRSTSGKAVVVIFRRSS